MTDHVITIEVSTDGGHTFGAMTQHDLGNTGAFVKQVKRNRCGQSNQFCIRISKSSPIKVPILAAVIQAESVD